ncbi:tyrosine-protein kinase receptor Tie-1-like [Lytechinus variegatus]|uniref:tyrosine-protein kinase receptor Tie-1-like n=1 Tax=Lytechinus variegatus TaxID=7654 RepID=UPI001BB0FD52|nr:tyrosine-protein kinase receptor Tie-1-like [Lytechinus variegatus]
MTPSGMIIFFCLISMGSQHAQAQDFPWAQGSSFAEPDPMPSHDYIQSYVFPEPANPEPVFPFPNSPYVIPQPAVDETHTEVALPVQPTQRQVLLPVGPTGGVTVTHVKSRKEPVLTTLSPTLSPDHYVRMTMTLVNPIGVDQGHSSFGCYLSQPDVGRSSLSIGRYSQTRDGGAAGEWSPPEGRHLGGHGMAVNLNSSGTGGFGTYYCQGSQPGKDLTTVIGVFLTSNPKIIPTDGRFTKTVSIGDVDVTIAMTLRSSADVSTNQIQWRKNGQEALEHMSGLASVTFRRPITDAVAGVYECYYANERNQARHGIMRLIVRDCPAGRWNPPRCTGICDACYNGGLCDHVTGRCFCPPGFSGDHCEEACGFNRFGYSCDYRCTSSVDESASCRGVQFCLPDPFGCTCNAGFKGLRCETDCDAGQYGAGCLQTCHCASGQCDRFTGQCLGLPSGCSRGWSGVNCQVPDNCPHGYYGPACLSKCYCKDNAACDKVNGKCPQSKCALGYTVYDGGQHCSGCRPGAFGIDCSESCPCHDDACHPETGECNGRCFDQFIKPTCQAGISSLTTTRVNTGQTATFNCTITSSKSPLASSSSSSSASLTRNPSAILPSASTVLLYRISGGETQTTGVLRLGTVVEPGSETVMFGVDGIRPDETIRCVVSGANGEVLAQREIPAEAYILPEMKNPPVITEQTATSISLRWQSWGDAGQDRIGEPPIVAYVVLYRQNGSRAWMKGDRVPATRTSATQLDLRPHTWYDVSVAGIREGLGGEGLPSPWTTVRTLCQVPSRSTTPLPSSDIKFPRQLSVAWQIPDQSVIRCPSGVVGFNIYYRDIDSAHSETGTLRIFDPTVTNQVVTGLHVYTNYLLSISLSNEAGEGERSEEVTIYSPQEIPPPPIHLTVQRPTKEIALISWETPSPANINGKIRFFDLQYKSWATGNDDTAKPYSIQINNSSKEMKYELNGLVANRSYSFKVRTVNDVGAGDWCDPVILSTQEDPPALLSGRNDIHGPKVGLSIMGVFVGLLLLAGLFVGVARFRRRARAQKTDELSTLRDTVAFSRPSARVSDLKGNGTKLLQDDGYLMPIATASLTKSCRKPKPIRTTTHAQGDDEHRYEYIDPMRFPVMRFAILANENETVIHSYR